MRCCWFYRVCGNIGWAGPIQAVYEVDGQSLELLEGPQSRMAACKNRLEDGIHLVDSRGASSLQAPQAELLGSS